MELFPGTDDNHPVDSVANFSGIYTTVSQAMLMARNACAKKFSEEDLTWARYVLFGDPLTHIG